MLRVIWVGGIHYEKSHPSCRKACFDSEGAFNGHIQGVPQRGHYFWVGAPGSSSWLQAGSATVVMDRCSEYNVCIILE